MLPEPWRALGLASQLVGDDILCALRDEVDQLEFLVGVLGDPAAQALAAPRSRRGALRMSIAPSDVVVMICA